RAISSTASTSTAARASPAPATAAPASSSASSRPDVPPSTAPPARSADAMTDHRIILFRGMNTGGVRAPVAEQRAMAAEMGLKNPRTLLASGNLVVESGKATAALEGEIEAAMQATFGLKVAAMARTPDQWAGLIAANPF